MPDLIIETMRIGIPDFEANENQEELVILAIRNYGHLIRCVQPKSMTFAEFADIIEEHYDPKNPQTAEIIKALRNVEAQNSSINSGTDDVVIGGIYCGKMIAENLYAEQVASCRWLIRSTSTSPDFAKRLGEVMGSGHKYQAMLMHGDFVGIRPSLVTAAQLLLPQ